MICAIGSSALQRPPSIVATPNVKAHPAPDAMPGWRWHHGIHHLQDLQPGYTR